MALKAGWTTDADAGGTLQESADDLVGVRILEVEETGMQGRVARDERRLVQVRRRKRRWMKGPVARTWRKQKMTQHVRGR